jgi:hypothetical protein
MDVPRKIWLVCNPGSGSNNPEALDMLHEHCGAQGLQVERRVEFPDEALPAADTLDAAGVDCVAVFAGDGTVNSCVSELYGWRGAVLVLPGGTMNLLARRLHGEMPAEQIVASVAGGGMRRVRPLIARTQYGDALAGLLAGPGTAWHVVREAMRDADVAGIVAGASEALAETTGGPMLHCREPALGRDTGYPLIEITPGEWGLQLDGYYAESAGDYFAQGWALLRRRFREGLRDRLGLTETAILEDEAGGSIGLLVDGEPCEGGPREEIAVARCEVDLIATGHG